MKAGEDLLLFRAVEEPARRALAVRLLDDGMDGRCWRLGGDADVWELHDATLGNDEEPVAVAATRSLGDGRRVALAAVAVAGGHRGRGIGQRMIEEVCDALRAKGAVVLVAAVPSTEGTAMVVVQRAGMRPTHVERSSPAANGHDVVWFDVAL